MLFIASPQQHLVTRLRPAPQAQRGMTLVVGLVLLVMITVVAVIGFRSVTLSERVAGNSRDRTVSFQAAESAGKEALILIEQGKFQEELDKGTAGYVDVANRYVRGNTNAFWTGGDGSAGAACNPNDVTFNWTSCSALSTKYENNKQEAQFVIERIERTAVVLADGSNGFTSRFRITTRSKGGSGNSESIVQVIFTRTGAS